MNDELSTGDGVVRPVSINDDEVPIVLVGGPSDIPEVVRSRTAVVTGEKIKISHGGGYEHFELDGEQGNRVVYRWTMRTKIAE